MPPPPEPPPPPVPDAPEAPAFPPPPTAASPGDPALPPAPPIDNPASPPVPADASLVVPPVAPVPGEAEALWSSDDPHAVTHVKRTVKRPLRTKQKLARRGPRLARAGSSTLRAARDPSGWIPDVPADRRAFFAIVGVFLTGARRALRWVMAQRAMQKRVFQVLCGALLAGCSAATAPPEPPTGISAHRVERRRPVGLQGKSVVHDSE